MKRKAASFLLLLGLAGCRNESFLDGSLQDSLPPVGLFYFQEYDKLHPEVLDSLSIRTAIDWDFFEPQRGVFAWDNDQAKKIDGLFARGIPVIPSIRSRSSWGVVQKGAQCTSAPSDLEIQSRLQEGKIYSESYAAFVREIAEHYQGRFSIVVIENEMNDQDKWCSGIEEYLRLFLTAKKAFQETDPEVSVVDGGIQGAALNWLVIEDYLSRNQSDEAVAFYEKFTGSKVNLEALRSELQVRIAKQPIQDAKKLLESPLFQWVDRANFHYYQRSEALPEVVSFLRSSIPSGTPLMSNEIGIKEKYTGDPLEASQEMVKKFTELIALEVKPVQWFSPGGKTDNNAGAIIDERGKLIPQMKQTFETIVRFFGDPTVRCQNLSQQSRAQFRCTSSRGDFQVLWSRTDDATEEIELEGTCAGMRVRPRAEPEFVVCLQ